MPLLRRVETGGVDEPWINPAVISFHFDIVSKRPAVIEAVAATGLTSKQLTPHTLRRSVATVVSRAISLDHASELLGHSDSRITKSTYLAPEDKYVSADSVDQLFGFELDRVFAATRKLPCRNSWIILTLNAVRLDAQANDRGNRDKTGLDR